MCGEMTREVSRDVLRWVVAEGCNALGCCDGESRNVVWCGPRGDLNGPVLPCSGAEYRVGLKWQARYAVLCTVLESRFAGVLMWRAGEKWSAKCWRVAEKRRAVFWRVVGTRSDVT